MESSMTYAAFGSAYVIQVSHMIKTDVVVNYG